MNFLASLLWLPIAPAMFGLLYLPTVWGLGATVLSGVLLGAALTARRHPPVRPLLAVAATLYAGAAVAIVALDALPGPGLRSAVTPRTMAALPAAPGHDFIPHANPVLHVIPTGERRTRTGWTIASGTQGTVDLGGALFVIEHPTYGLVIYDVSTDFEADASFLLQARGLDPDAVRTIIAADFSRGPGVAMRGLPEPWVMANVDAPRPHGPGLQRLQPLRFADNPGFGPFPHYVDLAGDGSILMLSAGDRVAVFARLQYGNALLAGDIAPARANLTSRSTPLPPSRAAARALGAVLWLDTHHPKTLTLPGWDTSWLGENLGITVYERN